MAEQHFGKACGGNPPANYERFFGAPLATDLIHLAALRPGERVLDVACSWQTNTLHCASCGGFWCAAAV